MEKDTNSSFCPLCQQGAPVKLLAVFLAVLSIFFLVKIYGSLKENRFIGQDIHLQTTIRVTGEGEVSAMPDIANFSFSVTKESDTVEEAQKEVADIMSKVVQYLSEAGVDKKNITTENYSVHPRYEWKKEATFCYGPDCPVDRKRVLVGYTVSQNISVELKDIDKAGEILSGIGALEVTNISGLSFDIDNKDALKRQARQEAIEEAQTKAKQLAKDLGVSLVRMISYSSDENKRYPYVVKSERAYDLGGGTDMAVKTEIPVGENEIQTMVSITYEIK